MTSPAGTPRITVLFQLFATHSRLRTLLGRTMADSGLRPDEYAVYSAVRRAGPLRITELARLCGLPLTTASDYVHAMTRRGHAHRTRNPSDGRSYLISLSEAGNAEHTAAREGFTDAFYRIRKALPVPEEDLARALDALDAAITHALDDINAEQRPR